MRQREFKLRIWEENVKRMRAMSWEGASYDFQSGNSIMQYIGREDINKKEIYEGDILEVQQTEGSWLIPVEYIESYLAYNISQEAIKKGVKIIGNVYENLELLTKCQKKEN